MKQGKFPIQLDGLQLRRARLESRKYVFGGYKSIALFSLVGWVLLSAIYLYYFDIAATSTEDWLLIMLTVPLSLLAVNMIIYWCHKVRLRVLRHLLQQKSKWRRFIN